MKTLSAFLQSVRQNWNIFVIGILVLLTVVGLSIAFSIRGASLMNDELSERLRTMAAISGLQFSAEDISSIHTESDMKKPQYARVVHQLNAIREQNRDIRFIYILRPKTSEQFEFVADADSLLSAATADLNKDGAINDEDQPTVPGTLFDASELPVVSESLRGATTTDEPYSDQWGTYMSAFAPIRDANGKAVAVLGIDVDAGRYGELASSILSPGALIFILIGAGATTCYMIISIWTKRVETLQRVDAERAALLRLTFHQIGQPLTILKWSVENLKDTAAAKSGEKPVLEHIDRMEDVAARFDSIFKSLHDADLVHHGALAYTATVTSLKSVMDDVMKKLEHRLRRKKQTLELKMSEDLEFSLDTTLITGVIDELVSNAIDFSPEYSTITVSAARVRTGLQVDVTDHGCGIPAEDLPKLFQEFSRASNAASTKPDGTGLGLYIGRGIIEKAGGRMWIESQEGKGTTVSFTLPLKEKKK